MNFAIRSRQKDRTGLAGSGFLSMFFKKLFNAGPEVDIVFQSLPAMAFIRIADPFHLLIVLRDCIAELSTVYHRYAQVFRTVCIE